MPNCDLSRKKVVVKNLVSHSKIKTKSKAYPNVHKKRVYSQALKRFFRFFLASSTLKTMDRKGGLDYYLLSQKDQFLSPKALKLKSKLKKRMSSKKEKKEEKNEA